MNFAHDFYYYSVIIIRDIRDVSKIIFYSF